jgi:hypothetical protein
MRDCVKRISAIEQRLAEKHNYRLSLNLHLVFLCPAFPQYCQTAKNKQCERHWLRNAALNNYPGAFTQMITIPISIKLKRFPSNICVRIFHQFHNRSAKSIAVEQEMAKDYSRGNAANIVSGGVNQWISNLSLSAITNDCYL